MEIDNGGFRLRSLVLPFYVPSAFSFLGAGMVMPILVLYARHLGASIASASAVVGLFGFGSLLFNVPAGFVITRFGKRPTILLATFLEGTIALVLAFARTPWFLALFVFLLGMVHTVFFVSRLSFFRTIVPAGYRGRALALLGGENRMGQFLGPIIGGMLAEQFGYRYAFFAFAGFMYLSVLILSIWVPRSNDAGGEGSAGAVLSRTTRIVRENAGVFATAGLAVIVLQLLRTGRQALIPLVGEAMGLSVSRIGLAVGAMYFAEVLLFYPAGMVMDRWGRKVTAVPCLVLFSVGLMLLPLVHSFVGLVITVLVIGTGNGMGSGINMTLSTDFAPRENPGEFIGVWRLIVDIGTTGGPFLVGAIAAALSLGGAALVIAGIGLAGATVMGVLVPEPIRRRSSAG